MHLAVAEGPVLWQDIDISTAASGFAVQKTTPSTSFNAGVAQFTPVLGSPNVDNARAEMEINCFGTLAMCRAFAPILKQNGGGALVVVVD